MSVKREKAFKKEDQALVRLAEPPKKNRRGEESLKEMEILRPSRESVRVDDQEE